MEKSRERKGKVYWLWVEEKLMGERVGPYLAANTRLEKPVDLPGGLATRGEPKNIDSLFLFLFWSLRSAGQPDQTSRESRLWLVRLASSCRALLHSNLYASTSDDRAFSQHDENPFEISSRRVETFQFSDGYERATNIFTFLSNIHQSIIALHTIIESVL